jgi:hypothetical protein
MPAVTTEEGTAHGARSHTRTDAVAVGAAALVALILFLTGWLLRPELPGGPYVVEWTGTRAGAAHYDGQVIGAAVGPFQARPGPLASSGAVATLLQRGGPVAVAAVAGAPAGQAPGSAAEPAGAEAAGPGAASGPAGAGSGAAPGPAALLAFYGPDGGPAVVLAVQGSDVLYRQRLRAERFRLATPSVRASGVLTEFAAGDTLRLLSFARPDGRCFHVQAEAHCELGHTAGSGWALLAGDRAGSGGSDVVWNAAWLALLLLPLGRLARVRVALLILVAAVWYMVVRLPVDTVLLPAPLTDLAGAAAGLVAGVVWRWRTLRRRASVPAAPA